METILEQQNQFLKRWCVELKIDENSEIEKFKIRLKNVLNNFKTNFLKIHMNGENTIYGNLKEK